MSRSFGVLSLTLDPRAEQIFRAYLQCYTFPRNALEEATPLFVSGGMILPENRQLDIPSFFPGLFFRLFS